MKKGWYILAQDEAAPRGPFETQELAEIAAGLRPPVLAMDRNLYDPATGKRIMSSDRMALDRSASARRYDADGHLHVDRTPISKANVCEYYGYEIPDSGALGLKQNQKYRLLRHPDELAKAAASSNGKQLLLGHTPVSADEPQKDKQVGSTGTDAEYKHPFLYNSLHLHDREGIDAIEKADKEPSEGAKELSSAYRYRADMTPGVYEGAAYDGVMRDIDFNHVALVPEGRAGADVVVGDSQIKDTKEIFMSKKVLSRFAGASMVALGMYLRPKLAQDAKVDLEPLFDGVSKKNFNKTTLTAAITKATEGKLAKDASLGDVTEFLDQLEKCDVMEGADADPASGLPMNAEEMAKKKAEDKKAKDAAGKEFLKGKLSAEDLKAYDDLTGETAEDSEAEENAEGEGSKKTEEEPVKDAEPVTAKAMDAAIKAATTATETRIRNQMKAVAEAREHVLPKVGKLVGALALDSAPDVYRAALDVLGVSHKGVHDDALKPIFDAQPKPGSQTGLAQDRQLSGDTASFRSRWGEAADRLAS